MALFEFPVPLARIEVDSRIRLAGTQRVTALAELADGALYAAVADISVTISGCLDGT
jgi:sulfur-oxidizing protein SoxY